MCSGTTVLLFHVWRPASDSVFVRVRRNPWQFHYNSHDTIFTPSAIVDCAIIGRFEAQKLSFAGSILHMHLSIVCSCILDKHCDKEKVPCIAMWRKWQIADALNHLKKALNCQLCMSNSFHDISLKSTCGCCIGWKPLCMGGRWSIATVTNSYLQTYLYIHALFSIASHIPHRHWGQNNSQEL